MLRDERPSGSGPGSSYRSESLETGGADPVRLQKYTTMPHSTASGSVQIYLDKAYEVLPGDTLVGVVQLLLKDTKSLVKVDLRLSCDTVVQCSNPLDPNLEDPSKRSTLPVATSTRNIIHLGQMLWSAEKNQDLPAYENTVRFAYKFPIPLSYDCNGEKKSLPPTFFDKDDIHGMKAEYKLIAIARFKNEKQLVDVRPFTVKQKSLSRAELEKFQVQMYTDDIYIPAPITQQIQRRDSESTKPVSMVSVGGSSRSSNYSTIPASLRSNCQLPFRALLLTNVAPSEFRSTSDSTLVLSEVEVSLISYTNIKIKDMTLSMYKNGGVLTTSYGGSISLDMTKLEDYIPGREIGMGYAIDFTEHIPVIKIPKVTTTFDTQDMDHVHVLQFSMFAGFRKCGEDAQRFVEVHQPVHIVEVVKGEEEEKEEFQFKPVIGWIRCSFSGRPGAPDTAALIFSSLAAQAALMLC